MDCCSKSSFDSSTLPFNCLIFDLDDTLYPSSAGIAKSCRKNIEDFLVEVCGFAESKASTMRVELFRTYGSTLAGLRVLGYDIDADDYHSFVHGRLPYEDIKPDPQLRNLLKSITQRKLIFTNSDRNHAMKALDRLGIQDCFEKIICFETINPNLSKATRPDEIPVILKPSLDAMKAAIEAADVDPHLTLFFDDNVRNVAAGKAMGLRTALVGKKTRIKEADYALDTIHQLQREIPEIWTSSTKGRGEQGISRTRSELDVMLTTRVGA